MTSKLKTDVLETVSGSGTIALTNQLSGMTSASMPSDSVIQMKQFVFTGITATTAQDLTFVDTGVAVSITPTSASSKILVLVSMGKVGSNIANNTTNLRIVRDSTNVLLGDAEGVRVLASAFTNSTWTQGGQSVSMNYLDSPNTTSATTYKVTYSGMTGNTHTINYNLNDNNSNAPSSRCASTIIVMEIKG